jgi:hypothetical protein
MRRTEDILAGLRQESSARAAFIVDDVDEIRVFDGEPGLTPKSVEQLAITSLAGGVDGLLQLVGEAGRDGVGVLFHDHPAQDVWISRVREDRTLVVVFAKDQTPVHAIRLKIKAVYDELAAALDDEDE